MAICRTTKNLLNESYLKRTFIVGPILYFMYNWLNYAWHEKFLNGTIIGCIRLRYCTDTTLERSCIFHCNLAGFWKRPARTIFYKPKLQLLWQALVFNVSIALVTIQFQLSLSQRLENQMGGEFFHDLTEKLAWYILLNDPKQSTYLYSPARCNLKRLTYLPFTFKLKPLITETNCNERAEMMSVSLNSSQTNSPVGLTLKYPCNES